ncbi:DUF2283 domain-containing protein [Nocardia sp. NPDC052254]|uniref:DUF2283 domain-containing protein n=1 Tax=Nocardia sp. NPDC052254 TaxID=3155681 RepID=UPI003433C44F
MSETYNVRPPIVVSRDPESNAASIEFGTSDHPRWTLPVRDGEQLVGTLRFAEDGELLEIELLDAETQMPRSLRNVDEGGDRT